MDFFKPDQLVLAAIIAGVMQLIKGKVPKWLRVFLPFGIGFVLAIFVTVIDYGKVPPLLILLANMFWRGVIGAVLAMAGFDVVHKGFSGGAMKEGESNAAAPKV